MPTPSVLIENWLPIEAIGAESKRERGASSALPPLYFLHVWWARRPLLTSRAAILAGVLPQWSTDWPASLHEKFPTEEGYHQWVIQLMGIRGDPVKGRKLVDWAKTKDLKLDFHPYGGAPRAFTVNPSAEDLLTMGDLLEHTWGTRALSMLDPFAGGGSIPFEALRYGFTTIANDLNPVATVLLEATLDYPARFGTSLSAEIRKWGMVWTARVKERLKPYFPKGSDETIFAYLWARTVACPTTGKPVPLSPNWWLLTVRGRVAVKLIADDDAEEPRFGIVQGNRLKSYDPYDGTISHGVARSPWTGEVISGEYIKTEAQRGRMGQILYAVITKTKGGIVCRAANPEDLRAVKKAAIEFRRISGLWGAKNILPNEPFPQGNDNRPLMYGMPTWADFFSPRQSLAMGTFLDTLQDLKKEIYQTTDTHLATAVCTYLGLSRLQKVLTQNYNGVIGHCVGS